MLTLIQQKKKIENNDSDISTIKDSINTINSTITDLKKSVSDGKSSLASTITNNGVTTASDATFAVLSTNISTACTNKYNSGHSAGYSSGVTAADNRVNTSSANYKGGYNQGVTDADNRANTSSTNYKTGYNKGVTDADNRANTNSTNYKTGYNAGYSAGKNDGASGKYKIAKGTFVQSASSAGWRWISINTGLTTVVGFQLHGHYESNGYYGMGGAANETYGGSDVKIEGGTIGCNVSFIAGCNHTIYWLAYGY